MKKIFLIAILLLIFFCALIFFDRFYVTESIRLNNQAIAHLKKETKKKEDKEDNQKEIKENSYLAYRDLVAALAADPFHPIIHLNLGITFLLNKEAEKSLKEFVAGARWSENDKKLKFQNFFNAAIAATQAGDVDTALHYYQEALQEQPESQEVKNNIELLWREKEGQGQGQSQEQNNKGDNQKNKNENDKEKGGKGSQEQDKQDREEQKEEGSNKQNRSEKKEEQNTQTKKTKLSGESLSPEQMESILQEIKNQEQKIRAEEDQQGLKEAPNGKDW